MLSPFHQNVLLHPVKYLSPISALYRQGMDLGISHRDTHLKILLEKESLDPVLLPFLLLRLLLQISKKPGLSSGLRTVYIPEHIHMVLMLSAPDSDTPSLSFFLIYLPYLCPSYRHPHLTSQAEDVHSESCPQ